jgi:hypothetical protein
MFSLTRRYWPYAFVLALLLWILDGLVNCADPAGLLAAAGVLWGACLLSLAALVRMAG